MNMHYIDYAESNKTFRIRAILRLAQLSFRVSGVWNASFAISIQVRGKKDGTYIVWMTYFNCKTLNNVAFCKVYSKITMTWNTIPHNTVTALVPTQK